ncbi:DUF6011 domain-containing protein [Streptomyces sp. NPDC055210]
MKCCFCPQPLRTKESKDRGYGPICGLKNGLIPPPEPRRRPVTTPVKPVTTGHIHPDQLAIPIQPQLPEDPTP